MVFLLHRCGSFRARAYFRRRGVRRGARPRGDHGPVSGPSGLRELASSVFHATGKTKVLRNLAFIEHFGGFLLVWLLVAPQDMLGMGLGATGLALKTVTTQFIMVNLLFWMASRPTPSTSSAT